MADIPYGRPRLFYQHADGRGGMARDIACPSAPLRGMSIAGLQDTGTNFLMGTLNANCQWPPPPGVNTTRTRAFPADRGRSPFAQHHLYRQVPVEWSITYTVNASRSQVFGKHTYLGSPVLRNGGYTSTADCEGCAILVPVRHPLVWMRAICAAAWFPIPKGGATCPERMPPLASPIDCVVNCPGMDSFESLAHYWVCRARSNLHRAAVHPPGFD